MKKPNLTFPDRPIIPMKTTTFDDAPLTFGHTPGPWAVRPQSSTSLAVVHESGPVAHLYDAPGKMSGFTERQETMQANARIISIAPDLASAMEPVAREIIQGTPDVFEDNWNPNAHAEHVTLTIAECRAILRAFQRINQLA